MMGVRLYTESVLKVGLRRSRLSASTFVVTLIIADVNCASSSGRLSYDVRLTLMPAAVINSCYVLCHGITLHSSGQQLEKSCAKRISDWISIFTTQLYQTLSPSCSNRNAFKQCYKGIYKTHALHGHLALRVLYIREYHGV